MSTVKRTRRSSLANSSALLRVLQDFVAREKEHERKTPAWWQVLKEAESRIGDLLSTEDALEEFRSEYMRANGMGASRLTMTSLVNWTMERAIQAGPSETVSDLERYLSSSTLPIRFSIGVRGVVVEAPVMLSDGVELLPQSDDITTYEPQNLPPTSSAVITVLVDYPRIATPEGTIDDNNDERSDAARIAAFERLHLARFSIGLVLHSRLVPTVTTAQPIASVPGSGFRSGSRVGQALNVPLRPFRSGEVESLRDFHSRFVALPRDLQGRLSVALHRWHDSFLHPGMGADVFIDLGIGFESVFVSERAPEIRYRLSLRGARLLGGATVDSRAHMSKVLNTLYDLRSDAVHQGRITRKIPAAVAASAGHLAMDGEELLRRAIIAMVYRGRDDWQELEFA